MCKPPPGRVAPASPESVMPSHVQCPLCERWKDPDVHTLERLTIPARGITDALVCTPCFSMLSVTLVGDEKNGILRDGEPHQVERDAE